LVIIARAQKRDRSVIKIDNLKSSESLPPNAPSECIRKLSTVEPDFADNMDKTAALTEP
jgi:hypothetical protein